MPAERIIGGSGMTPPLGDRPNPRMVLAGRILTGLVVLFLLGDSVTKLVAPAMIAANSPEMGWPLDPVTVRTLGALLLVPTLLYVWPRTAVLGAVLITGYLGGAIATHARIGDPLFTHTLFGLYLGVMVWGGLWLRSPAVRALFPIVSTKD
jgi:hypothetical protein